MRRLLDALRAYWTRFLGDIMVLCAIEPGEDEEADE